MAICWIFYTFWFFYFAENNSNIDVVERILSAGADLNARTEWGDTPAHYAAAYSRYEVLRHLIDKGCEVHKPNKCKLFDK